MIATTITCDRCGEVIKDTVCTLLYEGIMGHNQVPAYGWQFHYNCFSGVVSAIQRLLLDRSTTNDKPNYLEDIKRQ